MVVGGKNDCDISVRIPTLSSNGQVIMGACSGTRQQLSDLVHLIADQEVINERTSNVWRKLVQPYKSLY